MKTLITLLYLAFLCGHIFTQSDVRKPPSITKGPQAEVIFKMNQQINLACKAEGTPAVTYVWKKNGEDLNLNLINIVRGSDGDIKINSTARMDEGFYQCFATNQHGTALSTVAHIQRAFLDAAPLRYLVNMTVHKGRPFVVQAVRGNSFPTPEYTWENSTSTNDSSSKLLELSQRIQIAFNGDLYFAYAENQDELDGNIYKSTVYNPYADEKASGSYTRIMVTEGSGPLPDFPPNITYFSKSQEVALIGRSIELKCFFSGKPMPTVTWSRSRNVLLSGRHTASSHGTVLTVSNISESDEGDYVCTATNNRGTTQHTLNIRVAAVPKFIEESDGPRNVNVTEGDSVTFNCSAFAIPAATVVWFRNGKPIDVKNSTKRFVFSNNNESLTIRDVCRDCVDRESKTDLMVIQCNASNVHGYAFAQGYLNVLLRTTVTLLSNSTSDSVDLTKKNRLEFNCSARSDPSTLPTVRWYKVTELVKSKPPHVYLVNGKLTINIGGNCSTRCDKHLGEYRCVADNGYSQDTKTVMINGTIVKTNVTIRGSKNVSVDFLEEKQFVFRCDATSDPSTTPTVGWYKTEQHRGLVRDEPPYVYVTKDLLIIMIDPKCSADCHKYLGEYRCVGDNGYSRESRTITLTYMPPSEIQTEQGAPWKTIVVAVASVLVLLLIILFLRFRSKRRFDIYKDRNKGRELPKPPSMFKRVRCDSVGHPMQSITDNDRSMPRECSMYDHIDYDSIDQALETIGKREGAMPHKPHVHRYTSYESIDIPQIEAINRGRPMLDAKYEDTKYDDISRKEVNSYFELGPKEVNPYLDLSSKEVNPYLDMGKKELNPYLDMGKKEMDPNLYMTPDPIRPPASATNRELDYLVLEN